MVIVQLLGAQKHVESHHFSQNDLPKFVDVLTGDQGPMHPGADVHEILRCSEMAETALLRPHLVGHGLERLQTVSSDGANLAEYLALIVVLGSELEGMAQCAAEEIQLDAEVLEMCGGVLVVAQLDGHALEEAEDGNDFARGCHPISGGTRDWTVPTEVVKLKEKGFGSALGLWLSIHD